MMSPARQNAASDSFNEIATVRIELRHTDPLIWRQVEVPTSITLKVLHDIIQVVMGWFDYHLWEFTIGKQRFGLPLDDDWGTEPRIEAGKVRLRDVLKPRKTVIDYTYDFGDGWEHRLTVTDVRAGQRDVSYPRYIGGERNGPPEDCGGIPGFYELLEAIADRTHPSHAHLKDKLLVINSCMLKLPPLFTSLLEWAGDYDPDTFRSNTPSVASQTAAMLPRRASPRKNTSARLPNAANKLAAALTGWLRLDDIRRNRFG